MVHTRTGAGFEPIEHAYLTARRTCPVCLADKPGLLMALCCRGHATCIPCSIQLLGAAHRGTALLACPVCRAQPTAEATGALWLVPFSKGFYERLQILQRLGG